MAKSFICLSLILLAFISYSHQEYTESIAKELVTGSMAAYCPEERLQKMDCGLNCDNLKGWTFVHQGSYKVGWKHSLSFSMFVNEADKKFMLAFRGTDTTAQLLYEIMLSKGKPCSAIGTNNGNVGDYFCRYYTEYMRDDILDVMSQLVYDYEGYDMYITGHSLGGAFATLAALDIMQDPRMEINKNKISLYTFGSPRVGDAQFVETIHKYIPNAFRVTHSKDLVPHVPPNCYADAMDECGKPGRMMNKILNFVLPKFQALHLKPEIYYGENDTKYKVCVEAEDKECSNQHHYRLFTVVDHLKYLGVSPSC